MSSPFPNGNHGYPGRSAASSPTLAARPLPAPPTSSDVLINRMRLKVLYTFDYENKTNCLARWPQLLDIRTAQLDETTQVGVIELKTCIQAIVSASPELVAKLGQDYTVYAYDYSEYETPLVGQGMLSWVLASSSATPSAPAHQSRTMVTGRVCKNLLLFGSNSEDTLEVKLRLVPVPTALQSEYIESMNKYRELSNIIPPGFDMASWTSFVQANPGLMNLVQPEANTPQGAGAVQREGVGIEHVQRLMNEQNSSQAPDPPISEIQSPQRLSFQAGDQIQRPSSAASSVQSTHPAKKRGRPPKRPTSQASIQRRAPSKPAENPQHSFAELGYVSNDDRAEEGPTRKRAKVSQADWPSSTNLGKQPDSLRVAASTAASVRVMQPQPVRPTPPSVKSLEPPPRAPTPVAKAGPLIRRPPLPTARSSLRRESILQSEDNYQSPYPTSEAFPKSPDYAIASPGDSAKDSSGTPMEMGSSPPVFPRVFEASSSPDFSPQTDFLPNLDSGFVSGSIEDLFNDDDARPLDAEDFDVAARCSKRPEPDFQLPSVEPEPEPEPQLPRVSRMISDADQLIPKGPPPVDDNTTCDQPNNSATPTVGPQALQRTASTSDIGQQAPQKEKKQVPALRRTQTWSEAQAAPPSSDGTVMGDTKASGKPSKYRPRSDSGSGAKRKRAVQNKLAKALAAGQMPPFCEHCGAIETPTWRKAWVKLYSGTPTNVQLSVEEGGVVTWQPLETNENGIITLYRVVKKTILPTDEGFNEILLCNPCGLWLQNRKCMRPMANWAKPKDPDEKERQAPPTHHRKGSSSGTHAASDASQGTAPSSGAASPASNRGSGGGTHLSSQGPSVPKPAPPILGLSRLDGKPLDEASAAAALQKAIQSSPARLIGSQNSPIEVQDLTPKPTRRLLFPSPSGSQASGPLHETDGNIQRAALTTSSKAAEDGTTLTEDQDKENQPPRRSSSPTLFKTPFKSPNRPLNANGDILLSAAKANPLSQTTPKRMPSNQQNQVLTEMTPFTAQLNQMLSEANQSSPSQGFDFPTLPSLRNTPGRNNLQFDFSNFDSQDFLSTDLGMPSSPPALWGVYEDPADQENWPFPDTPKSKRYSPEKGSSQMRPGLSVDENGRARVDMA